MPDRIELTIVLRPPKAAQQIGERLLAGSFDHSTTNAEDLAADPSDAEAVTRFATDNGLQILKTDLTARSIRVAGSVAAVQAAFDIRLENMQRGVLDYNGPVKLPPALQPIVLAVLGLDQTPIARRRGV